MSVYLPKLTVLGGSSPFTIELINIFKSGVCRNAYSLVLSGRNAQHLVLISDYARHHLTPLGWHVAYTLNTEEALEDADIIIHQNRYGGTEGRLEDERFAETFGFNADETLGPCGLKSSIRMAPHLKALAEKIVRICPDSILINLTNPLSIAVSVLHQEGVKNVIGICELPMVTFEKIAQTLELPAESMHWDYVGLNHRGFIYNLTSNGTDLLPPFLEKISETGFDGFSYSQIGELEAIPLKYFHLFSATRYTGGRATAVRSIGDKIMEELSANRTGSPPGLKDRNMDWYQKGVIPVLEAIESNTPAELVINSANGSGITLETKAFINKGAIETITPGPPPPAVRKWTTVFHEHEAAVLSAAVTPSAETITAALETDPLLAGVDIRPIKEHILNHQ